jgi:hypothetical protein
MSSQTPQSNPAPHAEKASLGIISHPSFLDPSDMYLESPNNFMLKTQHFDQGAV